MAANRPTSFALHIRTMFRQDPDIDHMINAAGLDLSSYDQVSQNANDILQRLKATDSTMMPPVRSGGPWPDEWISLFARWIQEGVRA
jgi:hypothetical protein